MSPFPSCADGGTSPITSALSSTSNTYDRVSSPPTSLYNGRSSPPLKVSPVADISYPTYILDPISIYDPNSIRRLQLHVYNLIDGNTSPPFGTPVLQDVERPVFERIRSLLVNNSPNTLFQRICGKFAAALECTDGGVCNAAKDFNMLCLDGVLQPCVEMKHVYDVVHRLVELMEKTGAFVYEIAEEVDNEVGDAFATENEARTAGWVAMNQAAGEVEKSYGSPEIGGDAPQKLPAIGAPDALTSGKLAHIYGQHGSSGFCYHSNPNNNHDGLPSIPFESLIFRGNKKRKCAEMQPGFHYGEDSDGDEGDDASDYQQIEVDNEEAVSETPQCVSFFEVAQALILRVLILVSEPSSRTCSSRRFTFDWPLYWAHQLGWQ